MHYRSTSGRVAKIFFPKSSDWPRPQITLRRSLIDKTTPTTPSRQSLIDKPRFGAIPSKCMRIDEFVCTMAANINESMTMHNRRLDAYMYVFRLCNLNSLFYMRNLDYRVAE